jgi:hypothetical protein
MMITMDRFGKDHWSTFAYIETRCVDYKGVPDRAHMRCNENNHPGLCDFRTPKWNPEHGTRLHGYFEDRNNPDLFVAGHDDWDCADDLEEAGLIEIGGTGIHPIFKMTELGNKIAAQIRAHKASGKMFATFVPSKE